jgi:N-acetylglucosamine-6-phosphate deacetylase
MHLRVPADVAPSALDPLLEGLRVTTIAPELPGALDLIRRLVTVGVVVSLGHSAATLAEARAGFAAGARSTTHLFNAMTGLAHRDPGLAAAALLDDAVAVELIADGFHVDPALWPIVVRTKPVDRVVLVSDAVAIAGTTETQTRLGTMDVAVRDGRAVVAGTSTLAGSVIALDDAVRQLVGAGIGLPTALVGASRNPLELLGEAGRGRIAVDHVADLVVLDESLRVGRVMREGRWLDA